MSHAAKVVILAAGLGKRMRQAASDASLSDRQAALAAQGLKALIPIDRPFLDYSLTNIADAGYQRVCLVLPPRQEQAVDYYRQLNSQRLEIEFAVQHEPLGTAHALASAADFAAGDAILALNGDNYYPTEALRQLREIDGNALAGFARRDLIEKGNIPAERIAAFSVIQIDEQGYLTRIVEKPESDRFDQLPEPVWISMNCWRFGPAIFEACQRIALSPRGEFELPSAVMYSMEQLGQRYRMAPSTGAVLDLSCGNDIAGVTQRLRGVEVRL